VIGIVAMLVQATGAPAFSPLCEGEALCKWIDRPLPAGAES
jgi:hypothetical protein